MPLAREGWIGISLLILTPILFLLLAYVKVLINVQSSLDQIATVILSGMILTGAALIYRGRRSQQAVVNETIAVSNPVSSSQEFEAQLSPKEGLCLGDTVTFKVRFVGNLVNGYLGTWIIPPKGDNTGVLDYATIPHYIDDYTKGYLNGFVNRTFEWPWVIPRSFPPGKYEFQIRVHNIVFPRWATRVKVRLLLLLHNIAISSIDLKLLARPKREIFKQKTETVTVSERSGISAQE